MAPVFVLLASPLVLHERMTLQQGICAAVAVCGMVLVSGVPENGFSGLRGIAYGLGGRGDVRHGDPAEQVYPRHDGH